MKVSETLFEDEMIMNDNNNVRVSVAMAVYNSEKYIMPQVESILKQLGDTDELVISYNESSDKTWDIITGLAKEDKRIKVFECLKKGLIPNFDSAISHTSGKYIFLSDHDDVWMDDKINTVLSAFEKENSILVIHGRYVTDGSLNVLETVTYDDLKADFIHNFISNRFCGSCMAFKSEMKKIICPIPQKNLYHDAWIGLLCSFYGKISVVNKPLMMYRRHGDNLSYSSRRNINEILSERISTFFEILKRLVKMLFVSR